MSCVSACTEGIAPTSNSHVFASTSCSQHIGSIGLMATLTSSPSLDTASACTSPAVSEYEDTVPAKGGNAAGTSAIDVVSRFLKAKGLPCGAELIAKLEVAALETYED